MRRCVCLPLFRVLILTAAIGVPASATAAKPERSSPIASLGSFFRWGEPIPAPLRDALRAYEEGRFFAALGSLEDLLAARDPAYALDDATFLRALSLIALDWNDLAVPSLLEVLAAEPPGPYYVPALLELIEIHDRAGRWPAVADTWGHFVDRPLRSRGPRNERIAELFFEYGTLRAPILRLTAHEKSLLSKPKELAVILQERRERASDRLLYKSGLALLRLGRYEESLRALLGIGIESPYSPYAQYSVAQDLFALGRSREAIRALSRLQRYPKTTPEERALGSRARVLHAAIRIENGEVEKAIPLARSIPDDDPEAPAARELVATALIDGGNPALALAYDPAAIPAVIDAKARHALTIGEAYASLGDMDSAARVLQDVAGGLRHARSEGAAREAMVGGLRRFAEDLARSRRMREQDVRQHVSNGIRIVLAHDGPWNLGTVLRRMRAALGAGPYRQLAAGTKLRPESRDANDEIGALPNESDALSRRAYLASPRRAVVELALNRLADVESTAGRSPSAGPLPILDAYLVWLERSPGDEELRRQVARRIEGLVEDLRSRSELEIPVPRFDSGATLAPEIAAFRRKISEATAVFGRPPFDFTASSEARDEVVPLLRSWIDRELGALLEERETELRHLEFDLEVALSETLGGGHRLRQGAIEEQRH